jgi:Domain of unknown function (DUF4232)
MLAHRRSTPHRSTKRAIVGLILTTLALAGFASTAGASERAIDHVAQQASASQRCYAETGHCVGPLFAAYWDANGGLPINGYPISDERAEVLEDGKAYTVQYFERVRLEYHPENAEPYRVLLGQFGRRIHGNADAPVGPSGNGTFYAETGHNIGGKFLQYWKGHGGLAQFGYPLTEQLSERLEDGKAYTVQYFERARFELHPENAPPYDVLLGQFGRRILAELPQSSIMPCAANNLAVRTTGDAGAGQRYATIELTNTSDAACTLADTPQVQLQSASGTPLSITTQAAGDAPLGLVVVAPGTAAHVSLHWSNWCGADPGQASIRVMLPDNGGQFTTNGIGTPPCLGAGQGSTLVISPFVVE